MLLLIGLVEVYPKFADRTFPYVRYDTSFVGFPFQSSDVLLPNFRILVSPKESPEILQKVFNVAYFVGQWTDDFGSSRFNFQKDSFPNLVELSENTEYEGNLVVVGTKNELFKRIMGKKHLKKLGESVIYVSDEGNRKIMFIFGNKEGILEALDYLAFKRLNFKIGAYKGFFNFVRLRGYLEHGYFLSAKELVQAPNKIRMCFKNLAIASKFIHRMPKDFVEKAKLRNRLIFKELISAIEKEDKVKAISIWKEAMETCYYCHQEKKYRKYKPLKQVHEYHQRIALRYVKDCSTCHTGYTSIRGY